MPQAQVLEPARNTAPRSSQYRRIASSVRPDLTHVPSTYLPPALAHVAGAPAQPARHAMATPSVTTRPPSMRIRRIVGEAGRAAIQSQTSHGIDPAETAQ